SVAKSAIEIRGNNTLTADNINLTGNSTKSFGIDAQDGANTLNATNGSISLTGNSTNGTGLQLNGTNTLNATNGSISLTGNGNYRRGIDIQGVNTLNASNGSISLTGHSDANIGVSLSGSSSWDATNITITGSSSWSGSVGPLEIYVGRGIQLEGNFTFTGNVAINGTGESGSGVALRALVNLTFNNGTAVINGTSTGHSV
ncbi:filamentous hemagglutinin, partial [Escherichia coli]|nr:filamentous hemagglutinin [Escherichia coli]